MSYIFVHVAFLPFLIILFITLIIKISIIQTIHHILTESLRFLQDCIWKVLTDVRSRKDASSSHRAMAHWKQLLGFSCQLRKSPDFSRITDNNFISLTIVTVFKKMAVNILNYRTRIFIVGMFLNSLRLIQSLPFYSVEIVIAKQQKQQRLCMFGRAMGKSGIRSSPTTRKNQESRLNTEILVYLYSLQHKQCERLLLFALKSLKWRGQGENFDFIFYILMLQLVVLYYCLFFST